MRPDYLCSLADGELVELYAEECSRRMREYLAREIERRALWDCVEENSTHAAQNFY